MKSMDFFQKKLICLKTIFILGGLALLSACSSSSGTSVTGYNVAVKLTDASGCDYNNIVVTINQVALNTRINANRDDNDWTTVTLNPPVTIDLLTLQNGNTLNLANLNIPAGTYQSILLSVVPNVQGSSIYNDYVTLISNPAKQIPLSLPPGFPNKVAINFNKPLTVSANGTASSVVIDFDACGSVITVTNDQGNVTYILKPRLAEMNEDASGGINGAVTTSSPNATVPGHLVVKAEVKGVDGNYYVVRQTRTNADGTFKLYPLEYDDFSKGVYDVVVVSDNYGTLAIQDVIVPANNEMPVSAVTFATVGTIKLDTIFANSWSTTGTFTGTIFPTGADVRIRETVGGRTYQVRRQHSDLQTGIFTFPLSWGATGSALYSTLSTDGFTADSLTAAGNYTADTPSGDWDNDDLLKYNDQVFPFRITDGTSALTITHNFTLVPEQDYQFGMNLSSSLNASVSGTITALNLPANDEEEVYLVALIDGKYVAGFKEVSLDSLNSQVTYTIDHLPTGATVTIQAYIADVEQGSSETISTMTGTPVTLVAGANTGPDFTLTE